MISKLVGLTLVLTLLGSSFTTGVDPEDCATVDAEKDAQGVWDFEGGCSSSGQQCDELNACDEGQISSQGGDVITYTCGCLSGPECCRIVLVSTKGGPKLPEATGYCSIQMAGCPPGNTCGMVGGGAGDSTASRNCTTEPQGT